MDHEDSFIVRVGMFFLVLGGGAFILFVASDLADKADFDYLFGAMILIAIGWSMWRKKPPPPSAGRFAYLRKMREGGRQRREEKLKAKEEASKK
jgi:hypothetical protein